MILLTGWASAEYLLRLAIYPFDGTRQPPTDAGLPEVQEVLHDVGDGALVVWVADPDPGKPVIFYLHGNAGNLAARAGRFRRFLDRGYGLIAPAYPGSSGSEGTPSEESIKQSIRSVWLAQAKLLPVTNRSLSADTPAPKVILYGESLGTAVAIALLASPVTNADDGFGPPDAVILEAPFTSLKDVALNSYPQLATAMDQLPDLWPSLTLAGGLRDPLLILHGTQDDVIPIAQGRQIFAAAPTQDKDFLSVQGAGHTDLWRSDTVPRLWRFIDRYGVSRRK